MATPYNEPLCAYLRVCVQRACEVNANTDLKNVNSGDRARAKCQHVFFKDTYVCCNWLGFLILHLFHLLFTPL